MENLTHTFAGVLIARTGLDRWAPLALPTAMIGANLPDVDIASAFWGSTAYLEHHRGLTHSILGVISLSLILAAAMWGLAWKLPKRDSDSGARPAFARIWCVSLISVASHPILDYTTSYGVRPFLPFSSAWYYGDLGFIYDPFIWLILGGAVYLLDAGNVRHDLAWAFLALLMTLFLSGGGFPLGPLRRPHLDQLMILWLIGLVTIVALRIRGLRHRGPGLARVALAALVAYWLILSMAHAAALRKVREVTDGLPKGVSAFNLAVLPALANPFRWGALFQTKEDVYYGVVSVREAAPPVKEFARYPQGLEDPRVVAASATRAGRVMLHFARYPFAVVEGGPEAWIVIIRDARYERRARSGFAVKAITLPAEPPGAGP